MCKPIDCSSCTGKTWIGCGLHIPYAMSLVPKDLWCTCISESGVESEYPPEFGDGVASEENELSVKIHPRESLA